ncbi:hypothetical protein CP556_20455 [Natrinema sp. CBA1119]|uniref:hypothetical protein n=1 Tax=Natrinema sp. CBA1119 TaxID=1608465 RepID=UPI000BF36A67|nr:hypothetical protein [Natrinema sp. CBA1119]PGF14489.1 hypothetical protein CP556_20455 [Natrinema sp. CBA1119]
MSSIIIDEISTHEATLECSVRSSADLERFFTDESFRTSYDVPIGDVPEGVLAIPVLAQVCPVAWANGADVYVDEVDATFARALEDVKESLCDMHDFLEGGTLYARRTIEPEPDATGESGLLFTGGVDSTCSYVRHREESPTLISVRGWTITPDAADDGKWDALRERVRWAGTRCHHDAYELTRQECLDVIADYVRDEDPELQLQTCNDCMDGNCGECEKCYRTAVSLRLSGLEPSNHSYLFSDADYRDLCRSLERGDWVLGQDERHMWADIRERASETELATPAERTFFEWLETADLADLISSSGSPLVHRLLWAGARNAPNSVYNTVYPAWTTAKAGLRLVRSGR